MKPALKKIVNYFRLFPVLKEMRLRERRILKYIGCSSHMPSHGEFTIVCSLTLTARGSTSDFTI